MDKLTRDGVALAYVEAGRGAPPLVLVHGWCGDHSYMAAQFAHFGRAHRVVSVDLRGHGESDAPAQEYTVPGFADDLAWLCARLGVTKPVVVGHSMGGNIAFELARRHPDLPAAIVAVDSAIVLPPRIREATQELAAALRGPDWQAVQRGVAESLFLPTDDPGLKAQIVAGMASLPQHVTLSALEHHIITWDGEAAAAACTVPALLIAAATPLSDLERFRRVTPQLVTGQTVGAGHFSNRIVPDQVNAMIDRFLTITPIAAAAGG